MWSFPGGSIIPSSPKQQHRYPKKSLYMKQGEASRRWHVPNHYSKVHHSHIYTYIYICIHKFIYSYIHIYSFFHIHINTYTHIYKYTYIQMTNLTLKGLEPGRKGLEPGPEHFRWAPIISPVLLVHQNPDIFVSGVICRKNWKPRWFLISLNVIGYNIKIFTMLLHLRCFVWFCIWK